MKLNISEHQLRRIAIAHGKKVGVNIQLKLDQIGNGAEVSLTDKQITKIKKAQQNKKGVRLELSYNQISTKEGGFLPLLLAGLAAIGSIATGASAIANAVNTKNAKDKELEELKRHNKAIEGKGISKKKI